MPVSVEHPHAKSAQQVLAALESTGTGLSSAEAARRLKAIGPNSLPRARQPGFARVFFRQFLSPLIYILLFAAAVSLFLGEWTDAGFIFFVLILNAAIGAVQEHQAQRQAEALQNLVRVKARVDRDGESCEIDAEDLVPGDVVLLESGDKVPADLRILDEFGLDIDESLLTGESMPVSKERELTLPTETPMAERKNMVFAGTLVVRGRGRGVVCATGLRMELGRLAEAVLGGEKSVAPLLQRMKRFTTWIGIAYVLVVILIGVVAFAQGKPLYEIFLLAVALAVAAIPEGLPVAITIALSVGLSRMAKRNVIVRKLVAAEALGSCTYIAADKTGTLTVNELTVRRVQLPGEEPWEITGQGMIPEGELAAPDAAAADRVRRLARAGVLCNEAYLGRRHDEWVHHGDAVDVALLVMGHKLGLPQGKTQSTHSQVASIPFESERLHAASLNRFDDRVRVSVKGAVERVLPMCTTMATAGGEVALDAERIGRDAAALAAAGFRVLAVAESGDLDADRGALAEADLTGLVFLGIVGMIDPPRKEAAESITACRRAGIRLGMLTGDHPITAYTIGHELGLIEREDEVVTGTELRQARARDETEFDDMVAGARVFARVEPNDKLEIVRSLARQGHFVAVTGDGANDAPALRAAHVGVAMGKKGTDVARESAELIITDDNFASLVAGVEQGRIAYANVRKVIFLLISTGAVEVAIFLLSLAAGVPLPLTAIQLLWLNLVTEGIQDVSLAFEPAEGDEMARPPRPPRERIFNRVMIERVLFSAAVMGSLAFVVFWWLYTVQQVPLEQARNATLLAMVLFENFQVFNSRSETLSVFRHNPLRNRLLLFGTVGAQLVHIAAMHVPGINTVLQIQPVSFKLWFEMLLVASLIVVAMEAHKVLQRRRVRRPS